MTKNRNKEVVSKDAQSVRDEAMQHRSDEAERITNDVSAAIKLGTSNYRRLAAATDLLREEFVRFVEAKSHGRITIVVPFAEGDAQDIVCTPERRVRMK